MIKDKINEKYRDGLIDGEGSLYIAIDTSKSGLGFRPIPCFSIEFKRTEESGLLIRSLRSDLSVKGIRARITKTDYRIILRVQRIKDCLKISELLENHLILKKPSLFLWKKALDIMGNKRHLTVDGFLEVVAIRDLMSKYQKNKHKYEYSYYANKLGVK